MAIGNGLLVCLLFIFLPYMQSTILLSMHYSYYSLRSFDVKNIFKTVKLLLHFISTSNQDGLANKFI